MKKEFTPYEQALSLKELGFDEPCFATYFSVGAWQIDCTEGGLNLKNNTPSEYSILAPIYQQAFRWFREKYRLDGDIYECVKVSDDDTYNFKIAGIKNYNFFYDIRASYISYEEAELECLKKLIEIAEKESKNEPKETD